MANVKWRTKSLPLAEWSALQMDIGNLQMATGSPPNLAMFMVGGPGEPESAIYITGPGIEAIEGRSPGAWEDAEAPSGKDVALLVGEGDPWSYFGIAKSA
jgi:hypothetical protein